MCHLGVNKSDIDNPTINSFSANHKHLNHESQDILDSISL